MEEEFFFSGYCRQLDASRTVTLVTEQGRLAECDCCFGACVYEPNCPIAAQIREKLEI